MDDPHDIGESRRDMLRRFGASETDLDALLAYTSTAYAGIDAAAALPLADEPHLDAWQTYAADAAAVGTFEALRRRFVQLQFPIRSGISEDEAYRRATRRGDTAAAASFAPGLALEDPSGLELQLHQSVAGRIPVLIPATRGDFVALVQAFTERNEPAPVPASMGACMVNGLNNWDRIATYRARWRDAHGERATDDAWVAEFKALAAQKPLYQDRFIILSRGPYSATSAEEAGVAPDEWARRSIAIRREHECVHYLTYRLSGLIRSNVLDELVADFAGLVAATGSYSRELALRFLGLHQHPELPESSRLRVYRGNLSDDQLTVIAALARDATAQLDACARAWGTRLQEVSVLAAVVAGLVRVDLERLVDGIVPLPEQHAHSTRSR